MTISTQAPVTGDLRAVLATALDAVVVMTADGLVADWNGPAETTFGWSRREALGRPMADLIIPAALREKHWRGLEAYLATGRGTLLGRRVEVVALRRDGTEFPVELAIAPIQNDGAVQFMGFLRDISDRRAAEAATVRRAQVAELLFRMTTLAGETDSFQEALQACLGMVCEVANWPVGHAFVVDPGGALTPTGVWTQADAGDYTPLKQATEQLRLEPGEGLPGRIFQSREPQWIVEVAEDPDFRRTEAARTLGVRAAFGFPVKSRGEVIAVLEFFSCDRAEPDHELITLVRTMGEQVGRVLERKKLDDRQRLLIDELNHRVKNTLATVQSIAAASARDAGSLEAFRQSFQGRILALSNAHNLLTETRWEGADLGDIVRQTLSPYMAAEGVVTVAGPPVRLNPNAAVTVHMGLHEMATNAAKYGALSVPGGRLSVEWRVLEGERPMLQFDWRETGVPDVRPPTREGFGTRLIKAVARELDARVEPQFHPDGLSFRWTAAASRKVTFAH